MRSSIRSLLALLAGLAAAFGATSAATALGISPNPYTVNDYGTEASIELVAVVSGVPTGGSVLLGSVDPTDTTLVFRADVTAGTSAALWFGIEPIASPGSWTSMAGAGWIPGSGVDITSAGSNVPGSVGFLTGSGVNAGQSYDLIFISYDAAPAQDGSLEVATGITLAPNALGTATIVPEPASAALLALGIGGLAALRRRRA